jgi:hypothetical protein
LKAFCTSPTSAIIWKGSNILSKDFLVYDQNNKKKIDKFSREKTKVTYLLPP